jgi:ferrous iron transport protein A
MRQTSLEKLSRGQKAEIIDIAGGRMSAKRLADLGLVPGVRVKIFSTAVFSGPIEIEINGSKLILGRGLAAKILVKPI